MANRENEAWQELEQALENSSDHEDTLQSRRFILNPARKTRRNAEEHLTKQLASKYRRSPSVHRNFSGQWQGRRSFAAS
jgi:hypothetical protein